MSLKGFLNVGDVTIENSITGAEVNEERHLILYKADGSIVDCGELKERDPTVPGWAKLPVKPNYTVEDIGLEELSNVEIEELLK